MDFDPVSNLATWRDTIELRDQEDNSLIDVDTDIDEITISVRDPDEDIASLEATLTGGSIEVLGLGVIEFVFTADQMANLEPHTYDIGCLIKFSGGVTTQLIVSTVSIYRGL